MLIAASSFFGPPTMCPDPTKQYVTTANYVCYPKSRGSLHIASTSPDATPKFLGGYLSHPADVAAHIWIYKRQREIYRRTKAYKGEVSALHPLFPKGSAAATGDHAGHDFASSEERAALEPIQYSTEDDRAIEDFVREHATSMRHSMGTCRMAPQHEGGVVDGSLAVYGIEGLKIAGMC